MRRKSADNLTLRPNGVSLSLLRRIFQSAGEMSSFGPSGSLESRMATIPGRFLATSTQAPLALL